MADEPLAVYSDATFYRKQRVEIFKTKVRFKGAVFLKGDYESDVSLDTLSSNYQMFNFRNSAFWYFFALWILATIALVLYSMAGWKEFELFTTAVLLSLIVAMGTLSATTFRKRRMVQFLSKSGQPIFLMCKCGKDEDRFEQVVSLLAELIADSRSKHEATVRADE